MSDQVFKVFSKARIPAEIIDLINQRRLERGLHEVDLQLVEKACVEVWTNINPWAESVSEREAGEVSVQSILGPLEQEIAWLLKEPVPVDGRSMIKAILLAHHSQNLSVAESLERMSKAANGIAQTFLLLAKDYPSKEECIVHLTAEKLADNLREGWIEVPGPASSKRS